MQGLQGMAQAFTVNGSAEILGCAPITIRRMIKDGRLPHIKIGRAVRIPRYALEEILNGERDCGSQAAEG